MIGMRAMRHHFCLELICKIVLLIQGWFKKCLLELLWNSLSLCIFVNRYLQLSKKTDLWEILINNIYLIFEVKSCQPNVNTLFWKLFIKIFMKIVAVRQSKWKVFQKQTFHLTSTIHLLLRCSTEKQTQLIKTNDPISLTFFFKFSFFRFSCFHLFVFCISSNNRSSHRRCFVKKMFLEISQNSQ